MTDQPRVLVTAQSARKNSAQLESSDFSATMKVRNRVEPNCGRCFQADIRSKTICSGYAR